MCRICLNDRRHEYIDVMGPNEPHLLQHVKDYYRVEITGNDGKSTKLCQNCVEYIDIWQGHIEKAKEAQMIVNYLAEKRYTVPSTSRSIKRPKPVPNRRKKTSRRYKRRKRSSSISEYEIPSTSTSSNMVQSPLGSIQQSISASNYQHPPIGTPLFISHFPSTSTSSESVPFASTSASNYRHPPIGTPLFISHFPSTSTSSECVPFASTSASNYQHPPIGTPLFISNFPSTSTSSKIVPFASTSAENIPFASTSAEIIPFASTSAEIIPIASTSAEIIPFASTSKENIPFASTSAEIIPFASTSAEIIPFASTSAEIIPFASTSAETIPFASTSAEVIPIASTSAEIIPVASTSKEIIPVASTSAEINPFASTSKEIIPVASTSKEIIPVASTSKEIIPVASTSAEINPFASTSKEIIPVASTSAEIKPFASTSTEIIPVASTSAEMIPLASTSTEINSFASTSKEIIPVASTSKEIIPVASTSAEIVASFTINEISSTGNSPVWYTNGIETTDPESEVFAEFKSFKAEYVCIFCTYQHEEVSRNAYKHIIFCPKHSNPHACFIENCHSVFPNKTVFIPHYRTHLNLNSSTYLCHQCFGVLTCSRRSMADHTHQDTSDLFKCCSLTFTTMTQLVLHKLINHSAIVVTSNNRSRTLQKQNLNIKKTELENIKVGLNIPGVVPSNQIIKDNGSFKCYCCPKYFDNVLEFIDHTKIKHKNLITLKDKGIKLCPLCDHSYFNEQFSEHVEHCTNTLKVGEKSLNHYGCVHCSIIFTDVSPREIRNHVLYCKSFKLGIVNNKLHHKCINCTFTSTEDDLSLIHANSNCIYLKLKMRYAMGPDEKIKVMQRMEFIKQNTEQQEDKDSTNDKELLSSYTDCNTARQKLLKFYNYYCNYCKNLFFDRTIFFKHLNEMGTHCRLQTLIYCQKCLTEFNTLEEYQGHLPSMPAASPILLSIKEELFGQNNDEYENSMDLLRYTPNYYGVKVEMNNETFYQKQEPYYDETTDMQYQEQESEQEQEVSNNDLNNCYSYSEMELTADDIYMQCEVEEKPDLSQLLLENRE
ncbi:hypothetical protein QTP88_021516 [Uroleucon formosanum]